MQRYEPVLPEDWEEFTFEYMYKDTPYILKVKRGEKNTGEIRLVNDGKKHEEEILFT